MPPADPFQAFRFSVTITDFDGEVGFTRISGLNEETDVVPYREGNQALTMRQLRGLTSFGNITLERGLDPNGIFKEWRSRVADAQEKGEFTDGAPMGEGGGAGEVRQTVTITLKDAEGRSVYQWIVNKAWPPIRNVEDLDASSSDVLLENIELVHEGIKELPLVSS